MPLNLGNFPTRWVKDAACAGHDPELWWPLNDNPSSESHKAKLICFGCSVRSECLDYALKHREDQGIWGGTYPHEREVLRERGGGNGMGQPRRPVPRPPQKRLTV